jgi:hypothetical protein
VKIEFEDRTWKFDMDEIGVRQSRAISAYMGGMSLLDWEDSLAKDAGSETWLKAMECLYWLMLEQAGEQAQIGERDFAVLRLSRLAAAAWAAEEAAVAAGESPADPTSSGAPPAAVAPKPRLEAQPPPSGAGSPAAT